MSEAIRESVQSILRTALVTYSASYLGRRKRDGWECDAWVCSFTSASRPNEPEEFEFYTGLGLRAPADDKAKGHARLAKQRKPQAPHAADVLHSLILDSSACDMSFDEWCREFDYSSDSIKARNTYDACQRNTDKLRRVFSHETIETLRNALQDY